MNNLILNSLNNLLENKKLSSETESLLLNQDFLAQTPEEINSRSTLFLTLYPLIYNHCQNLGLRSENFIKYSLWLAWIPIALNLEKAFKRSHQPLIQGILGGQGTGKTTLSSILQFILTQHGYTSLSLSLDDLYKTYQERQDLQLTDPRLIWRGPPGTHDIELGIEILDRIKQKQYPLSIPRFDKSLHQGQGDRSNSDLIPSADIIFFEGWFVGVHPINNDNFNHPPDPIITSADQLFARDNNSRLADYIPLWQRLDRLMILFPQDYRWTKQWRIEAEHRMKKQGKSGMSDEQIIQFVEYFWKALHPELFVLPLIEKADIFFELDYHHLPAKLILGKKSL